MQATTTIGLDIARSVFQVHGIDAEGNVTLRRRVKRRYVLAFFQKLPPCLVSIEACAWSHYWSRELQALGHSVRLMPPAYVKPYVKRHKNDAVDAEAICEAVTRPNMRFVATKTPEQQSCLTLHRTRHLFIRQQTSVINAIRAHLAEFGIVAPVGRHGVEQPLGIVADAGDRRLPVARGCVAALGAQLRMLKAQILQFDRTIRISWASPRASLRSIFTIIADKAAFTCRVSSRTVSNPARFSPACSHADNGPASSPIRFTAKPSDAKKATRASGSLATFVSLTILPCASTTHTLESSNETSIPA